MAIVKKSKEAYHSCDNGPGMHFTVWPDGDSFAVGLSHSWRTARSRKSIHRSENIPMTSPSEAKKMFRWYLSTFDYLLAKRGEPAELTIDGRGVKDWKKAGPGDLPPRPRGGMRSWNRGDLLEQLQEQKEFPMSIPLSMELLEYPALDEFYVCRHREDIWVMESKAEYD